MAPHFCKMDLSYSMFWYHGILPQFLQVFGFTRLRIVPDMKGCEEQRMGSLPIQPWWTVSHFKSDSGTAIPCWILQKSSKSSYMDDPGDQTSTALPWWLESRIQSSACHRSSRLPLPDRLYDRKERAMPLLSFSINPRRFPTGFALFRSSSQVCLYSILLISVLTEKSSYFHSPSHFLQLQNVLLHCCLHPRTPCNCQCHAQSRLTCSPVPSEPARHCRHHVCSSRLFHKLPDRWPC